MSRTPMKLILTQEVSGLGAPGDVVDVAAGTVTFARAGHEQTLFVRRSRATGQYASEFVGGEMEGVGLLSVSERTKLFAPSSAVRFAGVSIGTHRRRPPLVPRLSSR